MQHQGVRHFTTLRYDLEAARHPRGSVDETTSETPRAMRPVLAWALTSFLPRTSSRVPSSSVCGYSNVLLGRPSRHLDDVRGRTEGHRARTRRGRCGACLSIFAHRSTRWKASVLPRTTSRPSRGDTTFTPRVRYIWMSCEGGRRTIGWNEPTTSASVVALVKKCKLQPWTDICSQVFRLSVRSGATAARRA